MKRTSKLNILTYSDNQEQNSNPLPPEIPHIQARVLECPDANDEDGGDVYHGLTITDQITMADVIVSSLWYYDNDAFTAFLDIIDVKDFSFTLAEEGLDPEPDLRINMTVQRHQNYVMVSRSEPDQLDLLVYSINGNLTHFRITGRLLSQASYARNPHFERHHSLAPAERVQDC